MIEMDESFYAGALVGLLTGITFGAWTAISL